MPRSPEMNIDVPEQSEKTKIENMSQYEREKIETILKEVESLGEIINNYLKTIDYCDENEIYIPDRKSLEKIRAPGGLADPIGPLSQLLRLFKDGMIDMLNNIDFSNKDELEKRWIKR
jgi:hypothetical protein